MVSLGTALKIAIPLALIAGFIFFRKQITEFVGGAAQQVGGGIGEAVGAGFRGIITELPGGIASGLAGGAPVTGQGFWDWFSGGGYLGEQLRKSGSEVPNQIIIQGPQVGTPPADYDDTPITPSTRDYFDSKQATTYGELNDIVLRAENLLQQSNPQTGHAERAAAIIETIGYSPADSFKESLPSLREKGYSVAEAYDIWEQTQVSW